jgi:hypothetical protein
MGWWSKVERNLSSFLPKGPLQRWQVLAHDNFFSHCSFMATSQAGLICMIITAACVFNRGLLELGVPTKVQGFNG